MDVQNILVIFWHGGSKQIGFLKWGYCEFKKKKGVVELKESSSEVKLISERGSKGCLQLNIVESRHGSHRRLFLNSIISLDQRTK